MPLCDQKPVLHGRKLYTSMELSNSRGCSQPYSTSHSPIFVPSFTLLCRSHWIFVSLTFATVRCDAVLFQAQAASHAAFPTGATNEASSVFVDDLLTLRHGLIPIALGPTAVAGEAELSQSKPLLLERKVTRYGWCNCSRSRCCRASMRASLSFQATPHALKCWSFSSLYSVPLLSGHLCQYGGASKHNGKSHEIFSPHMAFLHIGMLPCLHGVIRRKPKP